MLGGAVGGHAHRRAGQGNANPKKTEKGRPASEGTRGQQGNENYSSSDSNSTTVENDKSPEGPHPPRSLQQHLPVL